MPTIDADAHVVESEQTWEFMSRAEAEFRPRVVTPAGAGPGAEEQWLIDGRLQPKMRNIGRDTSKNARELLDVEARLRHMDELDVDIQVLYPSLFLRPLTTRPEVELALCGSYNRWLTEVWKKAGHRLRWVAVLPLLTMGRALAELKTARENGACGVFLRGVEGERRLTDPYFFPLYEEASRLDLPICVHASTGSFALHDFFAPECGFSKFKLPVVGAFHSLVYEEIPARFPRLRFGFIEVSAQWIPYVIHDLVRRFARRGQPLAPDLLKENRLYVACQTDDDLAYILKYAGEDNLLIGSDYGHADTSSEIEALRRLRQQGLPGGAVAKILEQNPTALYAL